MRVLIIQCYEGNSNGEISRKHVDESKFFYFHFNRLENLKPKKTNQSQKTSQPNVTLIVQYNKGNGNIVRMLQGIYHKTGKDSIFKIDKLLEIDTLYYEKVKEVIQIECNLSNDNTHYLEYKNLSDSEVEVLTLGVKDKIFVWESRNGSYESVRTEPYSEEIIDSYKGLERNLCKLAQRNKYARRVVENGDPMKYRTEFQRDWERIIHSKAFRRLEDKAQIYTLAKGDHFRTRLTHTLEVTQIARGLARELQLNEDLVEAIALGHDLGHTPFGHIGERTLHEILQKDEILKGIGGFKHNFQSVRVVNYLEEKYEKFEGLNLTYQVIEGILKHTSIIKCENREGCNDCINKCYKLDEFLCNGNVERLHPQYTFSTTLEGQVVAYADEIAQRAHDLDDGMASGIIKLEDLMKELKKDEYEKLSELKKRMIHILRNINKDKRNFIDKADIKRARIVSDLITFFMGKLVTHSKNEINKYILELNTELEISKKGFEELDELVIKKPLIGFDQDTDEIKEKLKKLTSNRVINSEEVNCFDGKGEYIIKKLYKAYYTNPRQLPATTLKRIFREISRYTNNVVDVRDGDKELVKREIEIYKGIDVDDEEKKLKYKIFTRCIVDLIAGMTDDFANKQFEKLYSPRTY